MLARAEQGLVVAAQRRAPVATDEASGVQARVLASRWRCSMGKRTRACTPLMKARPALQGVYLSSSVMLSSARRTWSGKGHRWAVSGLFFGLAPRVAGARQTNRRRSGPAHGAQCMR